nr:MAG TPA: hypothetical protein [Caudoviricetes sp.]
MYERIELFNFRRVGTEKIGELRYGADAAGPPAVFSICISNRRVNQ